MSKIINIVKSWGKHLSNEPLTQKELDRAAICATCPLKSFKTNIDVFGDDKIEQINGYVCDSNKTAPHSITGKPTKGCGCYLPAKVRSDDNEPGCPLGKW